MGARWTGTAWEIIDLQLAGIGFSLTWDAQGFLHVIYDESNPSSGEYRLWYAHWTGSAWITQLVSNDDYALVSSLALDAGGNPHIALLTISRDLKYLHRVNDSWITQHLDSANNPGGDVYLALDSQDRPHISYLDTYHSTLMHAYPSGQHWTFQPVIQINNAEYSFVLDHADNPHIAYSDFTGISIGGHLKYIWWTGSSWASTPVVDALDSIYSAVFLAVDTARQPHIAFITSDELRYAHWLSNTWSVQTIETVGDAVPLKPDLALDALNRPHIVYADDDDPGYFSAKYAHWTGSSWITQTMAEGSYYPSLELDTAGNPHIAYAKVDGVYYATWTGSTWITQTVASVRFPNGISLALDGNDYPHISYFDYDPRELKYAYWTGHTWVIQTLDSFSVLSLHPSLGLDSITRPFIVYFKEGYSPYPGGIKLAIGSWPGGYNFEPNYNRAAKPEEQVTYVHLLQNTGPVSDTYTLTHYSSQSWSTVTGTVHGATFTLPNSMSLSPGQTALITVTGTISSGDSSKGFLDTTIITATSTVDPRLIRRVIDVTLVPTHESYLPIMLAKN